MMKKTFGVTASIKNLPNIYVYLTGVYTGLLLRK